MKIFVLSAQSHDPRIAEMLQRADFIYEFVSNAQQVPVHSSPESVLLVLCSTLEDLLECHHPALAPIFCQVTDLGAQQILDALGCGAIDCWSRMMPADELKTRASALLLRLQRTRDSNQRLRHEDEAAARLSDLEKELHEDQRAGQSIQLGMLPTQHKDMHHYRFSRWVQPSLILSGDFIDYFPLQERYLACFLADVAGHGASSALLTVMLKNISWRLQQKFGLPRVESPGDMLGWINETLIGQGIEKHVAMFLGIIDKETDTLHYSMAAQYPPVLLRSANGEIQQLHQEAKPLGLFPGATYQSDHVSFDEGSTLYVFSDGVMDCLAPAGFDEKERALESLVHSLADPIKLWSRLCESLKNLDDTSLLTVQRERSA